MARTRVPRRRLVLLVLVALLVVAAAATLWMLDGGSGSPAAASGRFSLRLELPGDTFPADGAPIKAELLIDNDTGHAITIDAACNGWVLAVLDGAYNDTGISNDLVGCAPGHLATGTSRRSISIATTYSQCDQRRVPPGSHDVRCTGPEHDHQPTLPPGRYRVLLRTMSLSDQPSLADPPRITLTKR